MSDKFSAGVQILLKRMESNPDEFRGEYGRWADIRNGVFAYKEQGERNPWVRGLTNAEIDAMYEKLSAIHRVAMDEWVMKEVLREPEEEHRLAQAYQRAQGKSVGQFNPYQNALQPGTALTVGGALASGNSTQVKPESVMSKLKRELGL